MRSSSRYFAFSLLVLVGLLLQVSPATARISLNPEPFAAAFAPIPFVSPLNFSGSLVDQSKKEAMIRKLCRELNEKFRSYGWNEDACGKVAWKADLSSKGGRPLLYAEFGSGPETTLLLGGVHPDELTPIPIAFRAARHLADNPGVLNEGVQVIVAPLVNPDGFLRNGPSRTNQNGIDLNRNFFTMDWYEKAEKLWANRRGRVASHFPGHFPNSEVETIFQIQLIDVYRPDKILSIHAPLGFLDYDGPGDGQPPIMTSTQIKAKRLVTAISEKSRNYRVVDYNFYPGSLGNFAGNERHIPTVTLELQSTEPAKVDTYWQQFLPGIMQAFHYPFTSPKEIKVEEGGDASPFSAQYFILPRKTI